MDLGEHPLVLEVTSLRKDAARFQSVQHQALAAARDSAHARERIPLLEHEIARLRDERVVRAAVQDPAPHNADTTHELTLALRRASSNLDHAESALQACAADLAHAHHDARRARAAEEGAYALAARARANEEAARAREEDARRKLAEGSARESALEAALGEYADLVRSLEGRQSKSSVSHRSASSVTLVEGKERTALEGTVSSLRDQNTALCAELTTLRTELATLQTHLDAERTASAHTRTLLARAQTELARLEADDKTAAKMVSRYMYVRFWFGFWSCFAGI
ncbi:hypothetical protein BV22DRAFT_1134663 [Leucogyrophana mollusca]|uniref:Uncharacterized protein n=1 Tax=Leucogyrophana mollusca TaxID=85980 RepID=A0ACB8AZP2_9AGAM|nr:hypothetical protein BV22DRAFT_1134663 [Leucogyrophana mollusca]